MYDAQSFLDSTVTQANDTRIIPCPQGEFQAFIDKVVPRQWTSKDGTSAGVALDVFWNIEDQQVKQTLGREVIVVKQGIMLDLTSAGGLDVSGGKNVGLGRLREAVNLNQAGKPFSFTQLPGQMAKVKVSHRIDGEDIYAEIKAVSKF